MMAVETKEALIDILGELEERTVIYVGYFLHNFPGCLWLQ